MQVFNKIAAMLNPIPYMENLNEGNDASEVDMEAIFTQVREYSTIKQVFASNDETIRLKGHKIESIDCSMMSVLIDDVIRHKTVEKLTDENFIFIRRAMDVKTRAYYQKKKQEQNKLGKDVANYVDKPETNIDQEMK